MADNIVDFSSVFNAIIPQQLIRKVDLLSLSTSLCCPMTVHQLTVPKTVQCADDTTGVSPSISNEDQTDHVVQSYQSFPKCRQNKSD